MSILATRFVEEISERQSAMSHEYFGKRVLLGAQVAKFSFLALATRKHTTATALVHTAVYCPKTVPELAAAGGRKISSTKAAGTAKTAVSSSRRSMHQRTAKLSD